MSTQPDSSPLNLPALRRLCEGVTPGPWRVRDHKGLLRIRQDPDDPACSDITALLHLQEADAHFIAAARTALPDLLDLVERLAGALTLCIEALEGSALRSHNIPTLLRARAALKAAGR